MELPWPWVLDVVKKRAALGSVLEQVWVDGKLVDLSELSDMQERV